jgi:hypothetical protein
MKKPLPLTARLDSTPVAGERTLREVVRDAGGGHPGAHSVQGAGGIGTERFAQGVLEAHLSALFEPTVLTLAMLLATTLISSWNC